MTPPLQSFQLHLDQFQLQVSDLDWRLVSVLSQAPEDCGEPMSAVKDCSSLIQFSPV